MRRFALAAGVVCALARPAAAEGPSTHIALVLGGAQNAGQLSDDYGLGFLVGSEAAVQGDVFGLAWSWTYGYYFARGDAIEDNLGMYTLDLHARARVRLRGEIPSYVYGEAGGGLLRTSIPVPPSDDRIHYGPSAGLGLQVALGKWIVSFGARYGLFTGGPGGLQLFLRLGGGSK